MLSFFPIILIHQPFIFLQDCIDNMMQSPGYVKIRTFMLMCIASHHHQLLVFGLPYIALYSLRQSLQITINHLPLKLLYTRYVYYHTNGT